MTYRSDIAALPPEEAIEYLLAALGEDLSVYEQRACDVRTHLGNPRIGAVPLAIFLTLWDRSGRIVPYDYLCNVADANRDRASESVTSILSLQKHNQALAKYRQRTSMAGDDKQRAQLGIYADAR